MISQSQLSLQDLVVDLDEVTELASSEIFDVKT